MKKTLSLAASIISFVIFQLFIFTNSNSEENKDAALEVSQKTEEEDIKEEDVDQSIESIPFISEPVKKKRSRSSK